MQIVVMGDFQWFISIVRFDNILLCLDKNMTSRLKVVLGIVLLFMVRSYGAQYVSIY